jgi:hypothetical protein
MLLGSGIIKSIMAKRGYRHRGSDEQFSVRGQYARNLQYVYSKEYRTREGHVVDLLYFAVDILSEKLVIGLYRENPEIEDGVLLNATRSISLRKFSAETIGNELDKMIVPVKDTLK